MLLLWSTIQHLALALEVMDGWGFAYKSHVVWLKPSIGLGRWIRSRHEILLIGTRGDPPCPAPGMQWESVFEAPRGEHSAKPRAFYELVEAYFRTSTRKRGLSCSVAATSPDGRLMAMKPIELDRATTARCVQRGEAMARAYERGDYPQSLAVSSHGMEKNPKALAAAKMAECILAIALEVPVQLVLNAPALRPGTARRPLAHRRQTHRP